MEPLLPQERTDEPSAAEDPIPLLSLAGDILGSILAHLDLRDHIRLSTTCKRLRRSVIHDHPYSGKPFYLMACPHVGPLAASLAINCFLAPHPSYNLGVPPPPQRWRCRRGAPPPPPRWRCLGCAGRWLVAETSSRRRFLLDGLSRSCIVLPDLDATVEPVAKVVLSATPDSPGCPAAAVFRGVWLFVCRPAGHGGWVALKRHGARRRVIDVAFLRERLVVLFPDGIHVAEATAGAAPELREVLRFESTLGRQTRFLVGCMDRLLVMLPVRSHSRGPVESFRLLKYRSGEKFFSAVAPGQRSELDGGALLVAHTCSVFITAGELALTTLQGNCIYYKNVPYRYAGSKGEYRRGGGIMPDIFFFRMF